MQAESCSATLLISSGCSPSAGKDQWCLQAGDTCKIQAGVCGSVFSAISSRWTASSPKSQGGAAQQCRYNWILLLWLCAGWNWSVHALGHGRAGGGVQVMESTCLCCWLHHLNCSAELLHSSAPAQLGHLRETFGHMELDGTLWILKYNCLVCNLVFMSNTQGSVSEMQNLLLHYTSRKAVLRPQSLMICSSFTVWGNGQAVVCCFIWLISLLYFFCFIGILSDFSRPNVTAQCLQVLYPHCLAL